MKVSVTLRRLQTRHVLRWLSRAPSIYLKLKYLIQANNLYEIDQFTKNVVNMSNKKTKKRIQFAAVMKYVISENSFGDKILDIMILKSGSKMDDKFLTLGGQIQSLFNSELLSKTNEIGYVSYKLLYKRSKNSDICDLNNLVVKDTKGTIKLSNRHNWNYISKPHLLLGGNSGSGKSYLLFSLVHKMLKETSKENIYICDGKFDELKEIADEKFKLKNNAKSVYAIIEFIKRVENEMDERYRDKFRSREAIFLVIDEFAALSLVLEKDEFKELNKRLKTIILKGRSANIHVLIAMQRASSNSIDLDIRDNTAIRIGLGNLSTENFKMIFGESRAENEILNRGVGEGYILIDGEQISLFESPEIIKEKDKALE